MRAFTVAALFLSFSFAALAQDQVALKDRVKWSMWIEGVEEFQAPAAPEAPSKKTVELPEEVSRILTKYQL